jgi:hypothetical protein
MVKCSKCQKEINTLTTPYIELRGGLGNKILGYSCESCYEEYKICMEKIFKTKTQ